MHFPLRFVLRNEHLCTSRSTNLSSTAVLSLANANPKHVDPCNSRRFNQNPLPHATLRDCCSSRWVNLSSRRVLSLADANPRGVDPCSSRRFNHNPFPHATLRDRCTSTSMAPNRYFRFLLQNPKKAKIR